MAEQVHILNKIRWRHLFMLLIIFGSLVLVLLFAPRRQPLSYHNFADRRALFGVPNFLDVVSNLAFLIAGILGLKFCLQNRPGNLRNVWVVLFAGIALVSIGSAYYHVNPNNETLLWDRLPMTIGFMGLFTALLGEYINERLSVVFVPALILGSASVIYWHLFDDLRFYIWVQLIPLLTIPVIMTLYRPRYSHQWLLLAALGMYGLAKISELYDAGIFVVSQGIVSGHTLKHVLSAAGCVFIVIMLQERKLLETPDPISYNSKSERLKLC